MSDWLELKPETLTRLKIRNCNLLSHVHAQTSFKNVECHLNHKRGPRSWFVSIWTKIIDRNTSPPPPNNSLYTEDGSYWTWTLLSKFWKKKPELNRWGNSYLFLKSESVNSLQLKCFPIVSLRFMCVVYINTYRPHYWYLRSKHIHKRLLYPLYL